MKEKEIKEKERKKRRWTSQRRERSPGECISRGKHGLNTAARHAAAGRVVSSGRRKEVAIEEASGEVLAAAAKSFLYGDDGSTKLYLYIVAYTVGGFLLLSLDFFFFRVDIIPAPSSSHPRTSPEDEETVIGYKIMYGSAYGPGARWC